MLRKLSLLSLVLVVLAGGGQPVQAGGWGVTTLEHWPDWVVVDRPVVLRIRMRQHGIHLMDVQTLPQLPVMSFVQVDSGQTLNVTAQPDREDDSVFEAAVSFPVAGEWRWALTTFPPQRMPSILVRSQELPQWIGDHERHLTGAERAAGKALFVAKGCFVCHEHLAVRESGQFANAYGVYGAPAIRSGVYTAHYLRQWLVDPRSVRATARMPKLELTTAEIGALAAFINSR